MEKSGGVLSRFSAQFWLVIFFEFIERGAYYGVMSFLSVYFSDTLGFAKESVGVIKGVIQPLLYFLPILAGAVADRFGYRRVLMTAFSLLGTGYFLTSQMDQYAAVFISLVVMGVGAGIFKPVISGTIAKLTDEENSAMGFGVYYWSINLGAFLFPLILVPWLKSINPSYVLITAGASTALMIIPTWFFFRDPIKAAPENRFNFARILDTLAGAFEIIYSPVYLLADAMKRKALLKVVILTLLAALVGFSLWQSTQVPTVTTEIRRLVPIDGIDLTVTLRRNMAAPEPYKLTESEGSAWLTVFRPDRLDEFKAALIDELRQILPQISIDDGWLERSIEDLESVVKRPAFDTRIDPGSAQPYRIVTTEDSVLLTIDSVQNLRRYQTEIANSLSGALSGARVTTADLENLEEKLGDRPFFIFFISTVLLLALLILYFRNHRISLPLILVLLGSVWIFPGQSALVRIIGTILGLTLMALLRIPQSPEKRFSDHWRFLLMIILYSGFWVLYFQMYDSVLWYVQAYVDAGTLNQLVNGFLGLFGIQSHWFFDVEHVTVINAGTIILLQLLISKIVKNKPALPTMITGIGIATAGMAVLAISPHIGIFVVGLFLFSIGEMTAHPKFISYVGIIAPADSKGLYMGYNFLYGVFGSAVGGVVGAKMYVHFVERLNSPSTLWLLFSGIGVLTIISLLLYHRFLGHR